MAALEWKPRQRNYLQEAKAEVITSEEVLAHPLQGLTVTVISRTDEKESEKRIKNDGYIDPLSAFEAADPLSQFAAEVGPLSRATGNPILAKGEKHTSKGVGSSEKELDDSFEPWSAKRARILNKFTTSEKLTMMVSLVSSEKTQFSSKAPVTVTDKVKNRLEQLDDLEEGSVQEMLNLSQQDYIRRIEEYNGALIGAWNQDQKVKSLKIVIQCAKLLSDVSVIQFYPSKFVLITDVLDTFGKLVFDRILSKASTNGAQKGAKTLQENFTADQIPESAKETCRNWFFKIASIRELIPRFYVEAAILKCYGFLQTGEYNKALVRLVEMTRGIGDPLVGVYARCYLCRVGIAISPGFRDHLMPCFDDFVQMYSQIQTDSVQNILAAQKLELSRYLIIYSPALDWILQCIAHRATEAVLDAVLTKCQAKCNRALLLNSIILAFRPEFISRRAVEFANMVRECEEIGFPKHLLYRSLGQCVVAASPPDDQHLTLLNDVWKAVTKLTNPGDYIGCAEVWIEYVLMLFGKRELNTFLGDIIKHMTPDRAYEEHYPQLQGIVSKILVHKKDLAEMFGLDKFMAFIDMFQKESVKVEVCSNIMESYTATHAGQTTSDLVLIHTLRFLCQTMHDSVNALSLDDEVRALGGLINSFIGSVSFGRDLEQQLSFYVDCRAAFSNIDPVLVFLVHMVNGLAMRTKRIVGSGGHTRKTAAFVRACAAYSFITIPSLNGVFHRLHLYLVSGQVALVNQCLSQADAFFKAAILLITEVPRYIEIEGKVRSTEPLLVDFMNNFISTLLVVPDSPDQGVLYLIRGLLNTIQEYPWDTHVDNKVLIFTNMLVGLSAMAQDYLPYHVDHVESNDTLYGCDPKFLAEISDVSATLLREVLAQVKALDQPETQRRQAILCVEIFQRVVAHADLSNGSMFSLATKLWSIAIQTSHLDSKLIRRNIEYVRSKGQRPNGKAFLELARQMSPSPT